MDPAPGELPDEPGVNGAKKQLSCRGPSARTGDVVKKPLDFGAGEIGVGDESRLGPNFLGVAVLHELVDDFGGAAALPNNGVGDGLARLLIPDHGGLALVCDADGRDILRLDVELCHGGVGHLKGGVPDFLGVVLHPAGLREDLPKFLIDHRANIPGLVEENTAAAGCTLVKGHDVLHDKHSFFVFFYLIMPLINGGR